MDLETDCFGCCPLMGNSLSQAGVGTCRGVFGSVGVVSASAREVPEPEFQAARCGCERLVRPSVTQQGAGHRLVLSWLRNVQWELMGVHSYL